MADDRPKKSWRELDKAKDRSGGGASPRRDPDAHSRAKVEKSAAYSKYKSQLDKLFVPGGAALPESLREKLGPTSEESVSKRKVIDALKATPNDETLAAFLAEGATFPEDPRLLTNLLDCKDESLIPPVIEALTKLIADGKKPNRMLLLAKIDALRNRTSDSDLIALASALRAEVE